jgi:stage V sporulation protein D (sporulation-specific penicillin-binding protein)
VIRQTVSKETSQLLREYLEYAVEKGQKAYIEGYRIAGKTGTSEKIDEIQADGTNNKRIASFIGFAPADDPQICVLVVVDEPNSTVQYGSYIAAPLAKEIIRESLVHLNIEPDFGDGNGVADIAVPYLVGKTSAEASAELLKLGLVPKIIGGDGTINYQIPGDGNDLPKSGSVLLYTNEEKPNYTVTVPDVLGKTAAECNQILINSDLNIRIIGNNISYPDTVAVKQNPKPGEVVDRATVVSVEFQSVQPKANDQ